MNTVAITCSNNNSGHRKFFPHGWNKPDASMLTKQGKQVLDLMERDKRVTRMTALHYGIPNLTARITELRTWGYPVDCEVRLDANGNKYGSWFLKTSKAAGMVIGAKVVMNATADRYAITTPGTHGVVVTLPSDRFVGVRIAGQQVVFTILRSAVDLIEGK